MLKYINVATLMQHDTSTTSKCLFPCPTHHQRGIGNLQYRQTETIKTCIITLREGRWWKEESGNTSCLFITIATATTQLRGS